MLQSSRLNSVALIARAILAYRKENYGFVEEDKICNRPLE